MEPQALGTFDLLNYLESDDEFEDIDPAVFDDPILEEVLSVQTPHMDNKEDSKPSKRFKEMSPGELENLADQRFSASTKKNSKWGFNVFSEWSKEKDMQINLATIRPEELADHLAVFYAEAQTKPDKNKEATNYHRNSLKNLRSAINRYIQVDCKRDDLNIVTDTQFKKCNDMLAGKLKSDCRQGLSKPTKHKAVIGKGEMKRIFQYLEKVNPIVLRHKVWLQLSVQFVTRGLEFHEQLSPTSFAITEDETGSEYATLIHITKQKNHQGDINSKEENGDKRMYSTGGLHCPVRCLKLYLEKTNPNASSLFCHVDKEVLASPEIHDVWYNTKPVGKRQFSNFMADICRNAGLENRYTAHCLRATALSAMSDENVPVRHIMSLSDHSTEMSLIPYARPSTGHKQKMSRILSNVFIDRDQGELRDNQEILPENQEILPENQEILPENQEILPENLVAIPENTLAIPVNTLAIPENTVAIPENTVAIPENTVAIPENTVAIPENQQFTVSSTALSQNTLMNAMMNGFITNSSCTFNNCTFSFNPK